MFIINKTTKKCRVHKHRKETDLKNFDILKVKITKERKYQNQT